MYVIEHLQIGSEEEGKNRWLSVSIRKWAMVLLCRSKFYIVCILLYFWFILPWISFFIVNTAKMLFEPWLWCNTWMIISGITMSFIDNLRYYLVKHLWEYVITSAGNLMEEKSSVLNQISCMMILIPTVCCE